MRSWSFGSPCARALIRDHGSPQRPWFAPPSRRTSPIRPPPGSLSFQVGPCQDSSARASPRPVNINQLPEPTHLPLPHPGGHEEVLADLLAVERQGADGVGDQLDTLALEWVSRGAPAEHDWREEQADLVDLRRIEEGAGEV